MSKVIIRLINILPKRKSTIKSSLLYITLLSVVLYLLSFHFFQRKRSHVNLPYVVVHIDLKGSPPNLQYLESLLPMLKTHGVNGLLMEYEDMFPYYGKLVNLSSVNCYGESELEKFTTVAVNSGFEIIPLVQTFGHMEYVLKLSEYEHLREEEMYPDSICPSKFETHALIRNMLQQIIKFHSVIQPLKHIHIGCDEVYHINKCPRCAKRKVDDLDLYVEHINLVAGIVKTLSPKTTVLIWDDMLRGNKLIVKNQVIFLNNIRPVYWSYTPTLTVSHIDIFHYRKFFPKIWVASAFKGADGNVATLPNVANRLENHFIWMKLISNYEADVQYNFEGIILTGWSRYSHMDAPCELLPVSIPSLIINLILINRFQKGVDLEDSDLNNFYSKHIRKKFIYNLKCTHDVNLNDFDMSHCKFDGSELYSKLKEYLEFDENITNEFSNNSHVLSSIAYYSKFNLTNRNSMESRIKWCQESLRELEDYGNKLTTEMEKYFDKYFIDEYIGFKTFRVKKNLNGLWNTLGAISSVKTWHRRYLFELYHVD